MEKILVIILIFINLVTVKAQDSDTTKRHEPHRFSGYILPAALITYGIGARTAKPVREIDRKISDFVDSNIGKEFPIDSYTQFVPVAAVFGLDLAGIEAKNNFRDRVIVSATSYLLVMAITRTMKQTIDVQRPDSQDNHSFPSGHTATAFVGAHLLCREYKDASPWIAVAGYTFAAGTGFLRVYNKHHWFSDVITGAGIGILCAETGYLLLPVFHKMLGIKEKSNNIVIVPTVGSGCYGIGLACTF